MTDASLLTLVLTAIIGAAVFAYVLSQNSRSKDDRSSEQLAELQRTVRLLIERQATGATVATPQPPPSIATTTPPPAASAADSSDAEAVSISAFSFSKPQAFSASTGGKSPRSSPAIPSSPPSLSLNAAAPAPFSPSRAGKQPPAGTPPDLYHDVLQLQDLVKQLERRNRELERQLTLTEVSNVVDVERKYGLKAPGQPADLKLTPSEVETIRAIFNLFDSEQRGTISIAEIRNLHAKLGEPLSDEEAQAATRELDQDGSGQVNFHQFLYWWQGAHKDGKKSTRYTERFKLVHAKLASDSFNTERVITQDSGSPYTLEYRLNFYYKQPNSALKQISPWHDVPLYRVGQGQQAQIYNMVCEIPRYTRAKFECSTGEPYNPIKQDVQNGKLRYYKHGDIMFNYGFLPQTWEDPSFIPEQTGYPGDNDPIDVLDIGARQLRTGEIVGVKLLGVLALIDDGETDWKVLAICISDAMAAMLNDVDDVETHLPGTIKAIREYFREYNDITVASASARSAHPRCSLLLLLLAAAAQLQILQRQDQQLRAEGAGHAATVRGAGGGGHAQALAEPASGQQARRGQQGRHSRQGRGAGQRGAGHHRASGQAHLTARGAEHTAAAGARHQARGGDQERAVAVMQEAKSRVGQ